MELLLVCFGALILGSLVSTDQKREEIDIGMCMRRPPPERLPQYVAPPPFPSPPPYQHRSSRSSCSFDLNSSLICFVTFLLHTVEW